MPKESYALIRLLFVATALLAAVSCQNGGKSTNGGGRSVEKSRVAAAAPRIVGLPTGVDATAKVVEPGEISSPNDALGPVVRIDSSQPHYFEQPDQLVLPLFERPAREVFSRMRAAYLTPDGWFSVAEPLELGDQGGPVAILKTRHLGLSVLGGWRDGKRQMSAWCVRLLPEPGLAIASEVKKAARIVVLVHSVWADPECWEDLTKNLHGRLPRDTAIISMHCPPGNRLVDSGRLFFAELNKLAEANPSAEVHIVSHSTGGLVARYALENKPETKAKIASLTMLAPLNRGTGWAAHRVDDKGGRVSIFDEVLSKSRAPVSTLPDSVRLDNAVMLRDGAGAGWEDLDPRSEFFALLNRGWHTPPSRVEYRVIAGSKEDVESVSTGTIPFEEELQEEILGDGISSLRSAGLPNIDPVVLPLSHFRIQWSAKSAEDVIRTVGLTVSPSEKLVIDGPDADEWTKGFNTVCEISYSPDGSRLACAGGAGIQIRDAVNGKIIRSWIGHVGGVVSVAFSPDGKTIASGGRDNMIRIWEVSTGAIKATLEGHTDWVTSVAFSPDGKLVASGSIDMTVRLWNVARESLRCVLSDHSEPVMAVSFSPNGRVVASGSVDKSVRLWNVVTGTLERTLLGHTSGVDSVAFSSDGKTIATGSWDRSLRLWVAAKGVCLMRFSGHEYAVETVAISPDGRVIASGSLDKSVRLWNTATGTLLGVLLGHTDSVQTVTFSPDGNTLASGGGYDTIRLWSLDGGLPIAAPTPRRSAKPSYLVAYSPDGKTIASGSEDGTVHLWDVASGAWVRKLEGLSGLVTSVVFSPDGKAIVGGSIDDGVRMWDSSTGVLQRSLEGKPDQLSALVFSPDGKSIACASTSEYLWLWNTADGKRKRSIGRHDRGISSVAFSPDGNYIVTSSPKGAVRLWSVEQGTLTRTLDLDDDTAWTLTFSSDGKSIVGGSLDDDGFDGCVVILEVATGTLQKTLKGHKGAVRSVAFSPDGKTLACASDDGPIRLWNVETGESTRTLDGRFLQLAFSPDGQTLASAGIGTGIYLWPLADPTAPPRVIR